MAFRYSGQGWRVAHSIRTFGDQIMALRGHTSSYTVDGTLGNLEHSSRTSDHNPDENGVVRAIDFFEHKPDFVDEVFEGLRQAQDPRLKYAIHDTRMFSSYALPGRPAWEWREYTGTNPHSTHGHLSVVATAVADQDHEWEMNMPLNADDLKAIKNLLDDKIGPVGTITDANGNPRPFHQYTVNGVWHAQANGKRMMDHLIAAGSETPVDEAALAAAVVAAMDPSLRAAVAAELKLLNLKAV